MNDLTPQEKKTLELLKKDNFRGISKDNVKNFISTLEKLDPEVAKSLIDKMPEAIRGMVEIESYYSDLLKQGIGSCETTVTSCFDTEDKIVDTLAKEIEKDIPFEQKQYFVNQMVCSAERKELKDTEHRSTVDKFVKYASLGVALGLGILTGLFLGGNGGGFPTYKR